MGRTRRRTNVVNQLRHRIAPANAVGAETSNAGGSRNPKRVHGFGARDMRRQGTRLELRQLRETEISLIVALLSTKIPTKAKKFYSYVGTKISSHDFMGA